MIIHYTAIIKGGQEVRLAGRFTTLEEYGRFVNREVKFGNHRWQSVFTEKIIQESENKT